ncbi:MAG: phosphate-starvation-inducible PsiE family protein [Candidatus Thiodiazotropha sp.]
MKPLKTDHPQQASREQPLLNPSLFNLITRYLVSGLILALGLWIVGGIYHLAHQLILAVESDWGDHAEKMIIDAVILLAILELIRTLQSYLALGRVKVTLILDAALVVLIGELISLWYRAYTTREVLLSLGVIVILTLLRIVTVKYSPEIPGDPEAGPAAD